MPDIYFDQILFLIIQCFIVAFFLLALFRLRTVFGLSLLLTTLGVFQYMQVFLANALYFEIFKGIYVSSGSSILFTGSLFAILLVYIKEDTQEARKLIYAILSANIILIILQASISFGIEGDHILNIYSLPKQLFSQSFRISATGTVLLFMDTFLIIFVYEFISKYTKLLFIRILITTITILSIDSIAFAFFGFYGTEQIQRILISGLVSKNIAAFIYAIIFTLYLIYFEKRGLVINTHENAFKDIYETLTFRQKYEHIYKENISKSKELCENEKRFKTLVEHAADAYFVHDFNGKFVDVNERACKSLGYTRQELLTMNFVDIEQNFDLVKAQTEWSKIQTNDPFILYGKQKKKNGTFISVEVNISTFLWKNKKLYLAQARDITIRLQKDLELQRYASIVESSSDMMAFIDENFTYLAVNKLYAESFNLNKNEIIGFSVLKVFGKHFFEEFIKPEGERCFKGESVNYKKWFNFPAYDSKFMNIKYSPFYNEKNRITGFIVNARDITESKLAENKLIEANTIIDRSTSVAFLWKNDAKWSIEYVSENVFNLCGYTKEEFTSQKISYVDLIHPDDIERVSKEVSLFSENLAVQNFIHKPYRIISKNNKTKWVQDNTYIRRDANNIITHYEGVVYDITEKIDFQNNLIIEKNKAKNYLNVAAVILVSIDTNGIVQLINPKGCEILGYKEEEILGVNWFDNFIPKIHLEKIKEVANLIYKGELEQVKYYENKIVTKNGEERLIAWNNVIIYDDFGNITSTLSSGEDITERNKNEQELKINEEKYRTLFDYAPEGIIISNADGCFLDANTAMCKMLGLTHKELVGLDISNIVISDELKDIEPALDTIRSTNQYSRISQFKRKDGSIFSVELSVTKMPDGNLLALANDITERIKIEQILKTNEEKYRTLFECAPEGILIANADGYYIDANTAICKMLGLTHKELIGLNASSIVIPSEIKNIDPALDIIHSDTSYSKEWQFKRKDASVFSAEVSVTQMPDGNLLALVKDITERKKLKTALINEKTQLKAIIDNIPVMITMYDPTISMLYLNNEFEKNLGITTKEAAEIDIMKLFYPDEEIRKQAADFMDKAPKEWKEFPISTKTGEVLTTEWTNIKLNNGKQIGIGLDITEKKKTQKELNKTKDILLNTLENMTDGFVSLDLNWNYTFVNKKAGEILGNTPQNMVNKHIKNVFPEIINQPIYKFLTKAQETKKPIVFENYYNPLDIWFENRIIPSKDGLAIFFQNITERKTSEKKLNEYNNRLKILHDIDSAILNATNIKQITDNVLVELKKIVPFGHASVTEYYKNIDSFKFISVNSNVSNLKAPTSFIPPSQFNFLDKEVLFKGDFQIIEDLRNSKINSKIAQKIVESGLNSFIMFPLISENIMVGTLGFFSKNITIFTENNIQIIREIGNQLAIVIQQNRLKNEILEYTEGLEGKIIERTSQLEFSNSQLRDFAQIVSHDLKAPLRAISQLSYWVSEDYSDKIDAEGQEYLAMLISRVKRMDDLIEGVLQYSRAGRAREKEIAINLDTIVKGVIESLNPPENVTITLENKLPQILGDPTRFGQLFQNLINNALKFNDKPKPIINIGYKEVNGFWQFYVTDNGPGIEEKYFERIFQIFQRLESRDNQEGTGVGLTLVKRILQIYGGKIWIESTIGEGTTFYFTLPINK